MFVRSLSAPPFRRCAPRSSTRSLARLKAHPLAAPHAPEFEALRSACDTVLTTENALRDGLDEADTAIDIRDEATRAKLAELEMIMANAAKEAAAMKAKLTAMA
jgi:hypothetical protein